MRPFIELSRRWEDCGYETQSELAEAAGMSCATLSSRMTGRFPFAADEMLRIGELLDIPPEDYYKYFVQGWNRARRAQKRQEVRANERS